jgi:hypothetical protein
VKSSSAFDGLDPSKLVVGGLALAGLARGEGAALAIVLFAGLVWLD